MSRRFACRYGYSDRSHCEERSDEAIQSAFVFRGLRRFARNDGLAGKTTPMASIHKDVPIDAHPNDVWAAVRDFGAVHQRLVPGFVLDARLDGDARIVTFANGTVARELLVDCDDARRRLVYAVISERVKQHTASVQVLADGDTRSRLNWIVDVLPNEIAPYIDGQMDQAALAMQKALARSAKVESGFASDRAEKY
jgi:hypothetical protein